MWTSCWLRLGHQTPMRSLMPSQWCSLATSVSASPSVHWQPGWPRTGSDTKAAFTVMCSLMPSLLDFPTLVSVVMYPSGPSGPAMPKSKGFCFPLPNDSPIAVCRDPSRASRTLYRDSIMWGACPDLPSCTYADAGCGTPMGMQSWWLRQSAISMSRQPQQLLSQAQSSSKPGTAHQADPAIYRKHPLSFNMCKGGRPSNSSRCLSAQAERSLCSCRDSLLIWQCNSVAWVQQQLHLMCLACCLYDVYAMLACHRIFCVQISWHKFTRSLFFPKTWANFSFLRSSL